MLYIAYQVVNIKKMPRINRGIFFAAAAETKKISRAKTSADILTNSCMIALVQNLKIQMHNGVRSYCDNNHFVLSPFSSDKKISEVHGKCICVLAEPPLLNMYRSARTKQLFSLEEY